MPVLAFAEVARFAPASFVETGTGDCLGIDTALRQPGMSIQSIDLDERIYRTACHRFREEPRVRPYLGSSPDLLPLVVDRARRTMFWLDAHWSGGNFGLAVDAARGQCPLLAELRAIADLGMQAPFRILVDDARCFDPDFWSSQPAQGYQGFRVDEWPTLAAIEATARSFGWRIAPGEDGDRDYLVIDP
jgi:hypothetical protein